jgi:ubiquinone/menaquinone biosynthesis C-methylase UbiE
VLLCVGRWSAEHLGQPDGDVVRVLLADLREDRGKQRVGVDGAVEHLGQPLERGHAARPVEQGGVLGHECLLRHRLEPRRTAQQGTFTLGVAAHRSELHRAQAWREQVGSPTVPAVERYVISGGKRGYDRLAVLARNWLPTTSALFDRVELGAGMRCLDLGCGGGDVTFVMAQRVGSSGSVTGIDMDGVKLGLAREAARAQGLTNVEFRQMNVYEWAEPDTYDLAYCRFVLQHLSRPVDVLRSMWAAVRVGGVMVVEDADFEGAFCDPPNKSHAFWVESYQRVLEQHGGDPRSGRKLHRRFVDAGIPDPELTVVQRVHRTGEAKMLPHSTIEATADAIVGEGVATAEEVRAALLGLADYAADPHTIVGSPRTFQAWSRRSRLTDANDSGPTTGYI